MFYIADRRGMHLNDVMEMSFDELAYWIAFYKELESDGRHEHLGGAGRPSFPKTPRNR